MCQAEGFQDFDATQDERFVCFGARKDRYDVSFFVCRGTLDTLAIALHLFNGLVGKDVAARNNVDSLDIWAEFFGGDGADPAGSLVG